MDIPQRRPGQADRCRHIHQGTVHQHNIRGIDRHICSRSDRDAGIGSHQGRRVVDPVTDHDHPAAFPELPDHGLLSFRQHTGCHLVYAGSDFFLMPSRFEPCGLSQMIAMRYGSVPIVRETGGLRDTVTPYNRFTGEGNGFSFTNFDAWEMRDTMRLAMECYKNKEIMQGLISRAMQADFGFERSAEEYARHYIWIL